MESSSNETKDIIYGYAISFDETKGQGSYIFKTLWQALRQSNDK